jgi:hypothetical protein
LKERIKGNTILDRMHLTTKNIKKKTKRTKKQHKSALIYLFERMGAI